MTGQTYEHVDYSLGYTDNGIIKNYSLCVKGDVVKALKHRFNVNGGMTEFEAYYYISLRRMGQICFRDLYQATTKEPKC